MAKGSDGGSTTPKSEDGGAQNWSANGTAPAATADDTTVAIAEPAEATQAPAEGAATDDVTPTGEAITTDEAAASDEDASAPAAEAGDAPAATQSDDTPRSADFLSELAQAMRATADAERLRAREDVDRRRDERIAEIRTRETSEADRMRDLAKEDTREIDAWAEGEVKRIQEERAKRTAAVQDDLATSLEQHHAQITQEIGQIEAAIEAHRAELESFFERFHGEADPVLIAQLAASRPAFPSLDLQVVETAVVAEADSTLVGVMDPDAVTAEPETPWVTQDDAIPEPAAQSAETESDEAATEPEPEPEPVAAAQGRSGGLLRVVPVGRPLGSWLGRDSGHDDRTED